MPYNALADSDRRKRNALAAENTPPLTSVRQIPQPPLIDSSSATPDLSVTRQPSSPKSPARPIGPARPGPAVVAQGAPQGNAITFDDAMSSAPQSANPSQGEQTTASAPITFDDALAERQANTRTYVQTDRLKFAQGLHDKFPKEFPEEVPIEPFMRTSEPPLQPARAANFGTSLKANMVEDLDTKRRIIADSLFPGDPHAVNRIGLIDDKPVYVDEKGQLRLVSTTGGRVAANVIGNVPETAGAIAGGFAASPIGGSAVGAMGGRALKRLAGNLVFNEPQTAGGNALDIATEGGATAAAGLVGKGIAKFADRGRIADFTPQNVKSAEQAREYIKKSTGIDLDLAQASGNRKLIAIRAYAARYPGKSAELIQASDELAQGQFDTAVNRVMNLVARSTPAEVAGANGVNAAQMAIKVAREKAYNDVRPLYEAAYAAKTEIKNPRALAMLRLPYFDKAFEAGQRIARLEGTALAKGAKPDLRAMDYTKRALDDQIEQLQGRGQRQEAAALIQRKDEFVKFLDNVTNDKYQLARRRYQHLMETEIEPLENGAVGVLSRITSPKAATAAARIFSDPNITAGELRATRASLLQQDPQAWYGLSRQWMASRWNQALKETQTGEVLNPAGKLRQALIGTPADKDKVAVMVPPSARQAFDDLMQAAESLASTPIAGSNTMRDTEIKEQLKGTAAAAFKWLTSPRATFKDAAEQRALEKGTVAIAEAILDPAKRAQLRQVVRMAPSTRKAIMVSTILGGKVARVAASSEPDAIPDAYAQ